MKKDEMGLYVITEDGKIKKLEDELKKLLQKEGIDADEVMKRIKKICGL